MRSKTIKLLNYVILILSFIILSLKYMPPVYAEFINDIPLAQDNADIAYAGSSYIPIEGDEYMMENPYGIELYSSTKKGIDVSYHQGVINWDVVAPQIDFAILRCGYGDDMVSQDDKQWKANADACTRLGIPFGVYIYSYALTDAQALSEAEHVLRLIEGYDLSLPVYLDLEDSTISSNCSNDDILRHTTIFCNKIEAAGYNVGVYANYYWWTNILASNEYDKWDRWIARYSSSTGYSKSYSIWQYTSEGSVSGISGYVDMNYWYGDFPSSGQTSAISISGHNAPGTINAGSVYSISGTVSSGATLTNVTAGVYNVNGTMQTGKSVNPNAKSYSLKGLDPYVYFNDLTAGVYYYRVTASNSAGTTTLVDSPFIVLANDRTIADGNYMIQPVGTTAYALDIAGHVDTNEANVQLGGVETTAYQVFTVTHVGGGYYTLMNVGSGKYLDVLNASTALEANVQQCTKNGGTAQNWQILPTGDGYCLVPQCSTSMCADVAGGTMASGTNIRMYTPNLTEAQRYDFVKKSSEILEEKEYNAPDISNVVIEIDDTGYTITCDISDDSGIETTCFSTWTIANGTDDIQVIWKMLNDYDENIKSGKAEYRVNISDHNYEVGMYQSNIYAYDVYGNEKLLEIENIEFVDYAAPEISNIRVENVTEEGFSIVADISDNVGVVEAQFVVGDEFETYDATIKDDTVVCFVPFENHGYKVNCSYMVMPYLVDAADNTCFITNHPDLYVEYDGVIHKHSYSSTITKEATCTEDGVRTFICVCGNDTYTETIDVLGHVLGNWTIETEASCLKDGFKVRTCSRSGCTYEETEVLEASGHAYGGWKVIKEATDLETGLMERECVNCGNKEQEIIDNGTHLHKYRLSSVIEATCESEGSKIYSCTCGESYRETIDALGHVMGQWSVQKEAICDMDGLKMKACYREECDHTEYQIIKASGHDYGEWITLVEPTTEEDGVKERICANCGNKEYVNIEKLGDKPSTLNNPFKDVKETDYFYNSVLWAVDNKITSGLSSDMFAPNLGCTRAEVVTFLWRAAGRPEPKLEDSTFEDVPESAYYSKAVRWATEKGITSGYNDEVFGSNDQVTRCQFVTFLWRMENRPEPVRAENEFSDIASNAYYYKAVLWAVENGITVGYYQDLFAPDMSCTRCQVVSFLYRAYK